MYVETKSMMLQTGSVIESKRKYLQSSDHSHNFLSGLNSLSVNMGCC